MKLLIENLRRLWREWKERREERYALNFQQRVRVMATQRTPLQARAAATSKAFSTGAEKKRTDARF